MNKILVIGASGQVGGSLFRQLNNHNKTTSCYGTYSSFASDKLKKLDISEFKAVQTIISELKPNIVFLPACITNVDQCERDPKGTHIINVEGVKNIVDVVSNTTTKLVYFSTDFVFDGDEGLNDENSKPNPINEYGYQKLLSEKYIQNNLQKYSIIRTSSVYGNEEQGKNFICRLLKNLQEGQTATIPKDEQCTPTYNEDLAQYAIDVALDKSTGIYHAVGTQLTNRYKFALEAARVFGIDTSLIKPILSSDLKRPAKRPLNAGLSTFKNKKLLLSDFKSGLSKMKEKQNAHDK
jgi:dTDP-4-dehydrorhamnose reductase